jgi:hypothetical protein
VPPRLGDDWYILRRSRTAIPLAQRGTPVAVRPQKRAVSICPMMDPVAKLAPKHIAPDAQRTSGRVEFV